MKKKKPKKKAKKKSQKKAPTANTKLIQKSAQLTKLSNKAYTHAHAHTHTHIYIYIYILNAKRWPVVT